MNKEWEEEFDKKFSVFDGGQNIIKPGTYSSWVKTFIAKQRTQLLARVREEVIGEETHQYCDNFNHDRSCQKEIGSDLLKREQLKKLEIISEEGK